MSKHFPYPYLKVKCRTHNRHFDLSCYVDTGYEGGLIIPASERVGLTSPIKQAVIQLADGRRSSCAEYAGTILLEEKQLQVVVLFLGHEYLVGREVIDKLHLCFHRGEYLEIE